MLKAAPENTVPHPHGPLLLPPSYSQSSTFGASKRKSCREGEGGNHVVWSWGHESAPLSWLSGPLSPGLWAKSPKQGSAHRNLTRPWWKQITPKHNGKAHRLCPDFPSLFSSQEYVFKRQSQVLHLLSLDVMEEGLDVDTEDPGVTSSILWTRSLV